MSGLNFTLIGSRVLEVLLHLFVLGLQIKIFVLKACKMFSFLRLFVARPLLLVA